MKVLIATEKPFSKDAAQNIKDILCAAQHEVVFHEAYKAPLAELVGDAEALIIRSDKVTAEVIAAAPNLKIIVRAGAGYDNVDLQAATQREIVVMNTPGQNSNAVAELVVAMIIFQSRNQFTPGKGREIMGKTLGLYALGNTGRLVARKCKALGMKVVAYDPFISDEIFDQEGVERITDANDLYKSCDYVSLHAPATPTTCGMINAEVLRECRKGLTIINTARKELVNEAELMAVMTLRDDLSYITDIAPVSAAQMTEKFGSRYFATPKKMGAETAEANLNAACAAANQIVGFFESGNISFKVN